MTDLEKLESLKKAITALVASQKKFLKLSERRSGMSFSENSPKQIDRAEVDLNWHAMEHDKLKHTAHALCVNCGLADPRDGYGPVVYNPSPFHRYKYQPLLPECRKDFATAEAAQ